MFKKIDDVFLNRLIQVKFLILFPLFLFHAWVLQYLNGGVAFDYVSRLSFKIEDQPWLPGEKIASPYLGSHYFGDLNLGVNYAIYENPYDLNLLVPSQTPPIGTLFFKIFLLFGVDKILYIFLILNLLALLIIFYLLINFKKYLFDNSINIVLIMTSFPLLFLIDRGAVHLIVIGLIIFSLYSLKISHELLFLVSAIIACSLRPQAILIVFLYCLYLRRYRSLIYFLFLFFITNLAALQLFFSGDFLFKLKSYIYASSFYSGGRGVDYVMDSTSLIGLLSRFIEFFYGSEFASEVLINIEKYFLVPGLIYTLCVLLIIKSYKFENWFNIGLMLSTFSLVLPASMTYTMVWIIPALLLFSGRGKLQMIAKEDLSFIYNSTLEFSILHLIAKFLYLFGIFYGLIFHLWSIKGPSGVERFPIGEIINPVLMLSTVLILLIDLIVKRITKARNLNEI